MKVNTVIRIRKYVIVVIFDACKIKPVEQSKCVLQVHVIICDTMHDEEANVACKSGRVGYSGVEVAFGIVLGRMHVALGVDGVYEAD